METNLDKIIDEFEAMFRKDGTADIHSWLSRVDVSRQQELFQELLIVELFYCRKAGRVVAEADYRRQYPDYHSQIANAFLQDAMDRKTESMDQTSSSILKDEFKTTPSNELPATQDLKSGRQPEPDFAGKSKMVGPYKLLQPIGEGGMGMVWMADQETPVRRRVALKLIKSGIDSKEVVARFEAERQALAMMDHQNIAKVLDAGKTDDGRPYFVMELVQGIPFNQYCDANKLSITDRLKLFIPVCNAIQHAHQKGIIHRDLKPSNILITLYDGKPVPKVIDFGLAKALQQQTKLTDKTLFTEFGQVVGTLQYMSPEQAEMNALDIDTRTDIYSLGVMLYELLTGSTPIQLETLRQQAIFSVLQTIREQEPPRPSTRLSSSVDKAVGISQQRQIDPKKLGDILRGDLDWIVMKALEKDRTRRYDSATSFADDISRFLEGDAIEARPPSTVYRISKFIKKRKRLTATLTTVFLFLMMTPIAYLVIFNSHIREIERKNQELSKKNSEIEAKSKQIEVKSDELKDLYYAGSINLARSAFLKANTDKTERLLEPFQNEFDRRGFEWYYLKRLCGQELRSFYFNDPTTAALTEKSFAYSPDGKMFTDGIEMISSITQPGKPQTHPPVFKICVYNSTTREKLITCFLKNSNIPIDETNLFRASSVAFNEDGTRLAIIAFTGSQFDEYRLFILDIASGKVVIESFSKQCKSSRGYNRFPPLLIAFSSDDQHLATLTNAPSQKWEGVETELVVWNADFEANSISVQSSEKCKDTVRQVFFSPDGKKLVGKGDNGILSWDFEKKKPIDILPIIGGAHSVLALSPDGSKAITRSEGKGLKLWDTLNGKELSRIDANGSAICAAFSPDEKRLALGCQESTIRIWDVDKNKETLVLHGHTHHITDVFFAPDGSKLFSQDIAGFHKTWDSETPKEPYVFPSQSGKIDCICFSLDGRYLASGRIDGTIEVWDLKTKRRKQTFLNDLSQVRKVAFNSTGTELVAFHQVQDRAPKKAEYFIKSWNIDTGSEVGFLSFKSTRADGLKFQSDRNGLFLQFSPNGERIFLFDSDSTVFIERQKNGKLALSDISKQKHPTMRPNCDFHLSCTDYGGRIDEGFWAKIDSLSKKSGEVVRLDVSKDLKRLLSVHKVGYDWFTHASIETVKLWDPMSEQEMWEFSESDGANGILSLDGNRVAFITERGVSLLEGVPLTQQDTDHREAKGLVSFLYNRLQNTESVLDAIRSNDFISNSVRDEALQLAEFCLSMDTLESMNLSCWEILRQPNLPRESYVPALKQAELICRNVRAGSFLTTLGAAQYRSARYQIALETLTQANTIRGDSPENVAFLSMTQHKLGRLEEARKTLAQLQGATEIDRRLRLGNIGFVNEAGRMISGESWETKATTKTFSPLLFDSKLPRFSCNDPSLASHLREKVQVEGLVENITLRRQGEAAFVLFKSTDENTPLYVWVDETLFSNMVNAKYDLFDLQGKRIRVKGVLGTYRGSDVVWKNRLEITLKSIEDIGLLPEDSPVIESKE